MTDEDEIPPLDPEHPPHRVFFFPNGLVAVFDARGRQMPRYQRANSHREACKLLLDDGFHWATLHEVKGYPQP